MTNSYFLSAKGNEGDIPADIIFFLVLIVCIFTFYANSYFVTSKSKEMAIAELSGIWPSKLARMLLFQNAIIEIIGGTLGIIVGIILMPGFLLLMYTMLGINGSLGTISIQGIFGTIAILFLQLSYVSLGDYGYASSREILDLINGDKKVYSFGIRALKLNSKIYFITYFIPIISIFISPWFVNVSLIVFFDMFFTVFGISGILRYYIPDKILQLKKEKYINDKIKLISLSNLYISLKQLKFIIMTLAIVVEILLCIMGMFKSSPQIKIICICSYSTVIILIAVSIIYKIMLETDNKRHEFRQLGLIGYTTAQSKKIVTQEFTIFYSITVGVPLFHILIFLILFKNSSILSMELTSILLLIFIVTFAITGITAYNLYKKLVLKKIHTGVYNM
jgi:putative ABC transport system permease protein